MDAEHPLRVLLVDDHEVVRRGLRALLEAQDGIEVVGEVIPSCPTAGGRNSIETTLMSSDSTLDQERDQERAYETDAASCPQTREPLQRRDFLRRAGRIRTGDLLTPSQDPGVMRTKRNHWNSNAGKGYRLSSLVVVFSSRAEQTRNKKWISTRLQRSRVYPLSIKEVITGFE